MAGARDHSGSPGYSGAPLVAKLGIKQGHRVWLFQAPADWVMTGLPPTVKVTTTPGPADVVVAFFRRAQELSGSITSLAEAIHPAGCCWLAWPRRAGGHTSDITDNVVRAVVLAHGLVDVKVAALSVDWSGLKVVWRKERRA